MKIISFNINGLRAHIHQLKLIIKIYNPDIIGLQEIKVNNDHFPKKKLSKLGYNIFTYGQQKYNGVCLLSKIKPINIKKGFLKNNDDDQKRLIMIDLNSSIGNIKIINCYFPQGDSKKNIIKFKYKMKFFNNLYLYIKKNLNPNNHIIVIGDINVSITDLDIGIGEKNRKKWLEQGKCSFLPEERFCIYQLLDWGLFDIWRLKHPLTKNKFSWFDYRNKGYIMNKGLRIDNILITKSLIKYYINSNMDYSIRNLIKPSDHVPIWVNFKIN
ncbi:exodeoxyribonuclease III [Enterobacteriaceae endosymbiont of Donacia versicolorea]|uniref:exodeoxyribonuclease III n=1 Tax=Enterobacteriaceae endosymbiont of Donacia versicolorea TaxID=2675788 RepID=UPI001449CC3C|nr:exodeoxyribonuclease III [Enterobacteriaceae endosymbiont of Donacia versicolorea]QJC31970.1 exodeoxyribonuclease III [Enterobacteriaceae endosymbiont of Donacia versicolorea]